MRMRGMTEKVNTNNWDGILYPIPGRKDKVVITISGSEGGLGYAGKQARFLQENGIPALALGYFKTKNTGKNLDRIPLELIASAIKLLKEKGYQRFGICGISKGAEYALAAAIFFPELSCVIVKTPSWFYSEGMTAGKRPSGTSCWSYQGRELPFTPYKTRKFPMLKLMWDNKEFNILEVNTGKNVIPESIIPVEKIRAPILIFSTAADTVWPSEESSRRLECRLKEQGFPYPYQHISFEHMGHMMLENCGPEFKWFIRSERAYPAECKEERKAMGNACIRWIEDMW